MWGKTTVCSIQLSNLNIFPALAKIGKSESIYGAVVDAGMYTEGLKKGKQGEEWEVKQCKNIRAFGRRFQRMANFWPPSPIFGFDF